MPVYDEIGSGGTYGAGAFTIAVVYTPSLTAAGVEGSEISYVRTIFAAAETAAPALPENHCLGLKPDGVSVDRRLLCFKGLDEMGDPIMTCARWRKFRVSCPKVNIQCSALSEAWVAAITVCNQRLF